MPERTLPVVLLALMCITAPIFLTAIGPHGGDSTRSSPWSGVDVGSGFLNISRWMVYHEEWLGTRESPQFGWTAVQTPVGAVGATANYAANGVNTVMRFDPDGDDNEGIVIGYTDYTCTICGGGGFVHPAAGRTIIYETRLKIDEWDDQDYAFGLIDNDGAAVGHALANTGLWTDADVDDFVGFYANRADVGLIQATYESNTNGITEAGALLATTFADDSYHVLSFKIVGVDYVEWYVDGVKILSVTLANDLSAAAAGLTPWFDVLGTGKGTGAGDEMDIDYVTVAQTR